MMLTVTDAGKKFCVNTAGAKCLGDHCMAWRWAGYRNKQFSNVREDWPEGERASDRLGYCGLAGRSESA